MALAAPAIGAIVHVAQVVRPVAAPPASHVHRSHVVSLHRSSGGYGLGDEDHRLDGPALMLLPAGDRDNSRLSGPDRAWWVQFDGSAVRSVRGGAELQLDSGVVRGSRLRRLTPQQDRTAGGLFRELHAAWRLGTPVAGLQVRARLLDLLALWAAPSSPDDAVDRLRERIERDACDATLSLGDLARDLARDLDALTAAFRLRFGVTPVAYRTRQRLQLARELLVHDQQPLEDIARRCGFADAGYLCRVFRQQLGMSPLTYARRCGAPPTHR